MTEKEKQLYEAAKNTFNSWPKWKQEAALDFVNAYKEEPETTSLKLCPKCGGIPRIRQRCEWDDGELDITIQCVDCGLELSCFNYPYDIPHTSITWNYDEFKMLSAEDIWNGAKSNDG